MGKARPAIVVGSNHLGRLPVRVAVPLTDWKPQFRNYPWMVRVDPTSQNGLTKTSAADTLQIRTLALERFVSRRGSATTAIIKEVADAVALVVEHKCAS